MNNQLTDTLLMVRPSNFGFNEEAFFSNSFQNKPAENEKSFVQDLALKEFNGYVESLKALKVEVIVFDDFKDSLSPDSIFPNNWISLHQNGFLFQYSMLVENRRKERRLDIVDYFQSNFGYTPIDLSGSEQNENPSFLEGTGSMIFDHQSKKMYAAISPRTDETLTIDFASRIGYEPIVFEAYGGKGEAIYHTNVMLCIGETFAVIGLETIREDQRAMVKQALENDGKMIIELTNEQVYNHFAGNMLQIKNKNGERIIVMSQNAFESLEVKQLNKFKEMNHHLLHVPIPTIEKIGGGSVRCMIAEVFKPS
jgi:hypothetical protein